MNVLFVCAQFPFPPRSGSNTRVYHLLRGAAARHDVTLLSYALPEDAERVTALRTQVAVETVPRVGHSQCQKRAAQLRSLASARPFSVTDVESEELSRAVADLCARRRIDLVQIEGSLLAGLSVPPGVAVVLDEHNIEYEVFSRMCAGESSLLRRGFSRLEYHRFRRFERHCWTRVDGCAVTSDREEPVVAAAAPELPTAVVPNGVDVANFSPSDAPTEPRTLVFNGILDYRPNLDAAHHLVEEIWPRVRARCPDSRLTIVGRAETADLRRLRVRGVTITGEVPDVRPYLERAAVIAVPIRMGGGTRLKVVEALAMGKATVSTSLGCEGIEITDGKHLLVADNAEMFAARVTELFDDPVRRHALGTAGRRLAEEAYTWDVAGERLERLYTRVTDPTTRTAVSRAA